MKETLSYLNPVAFGCRDLTDYGELLRERVSLHRWAYDGAVAAREQANLGLYSVPVPVSVAGPIHKARVLRTINGQIGIYARDLVITYLLTGEQQYADKVRETVLAFPDHLDGAEEGRAIERTHGHHIFYLDDWLPRLVFAYDTLRSQFTDGQAKKIEAFFTGLLEVIADERTWVHWRHHNRGGWHAGGIALCGLVLGDDGLRDLGIERIGEQLRNFLPADGIWWEGSIHVHFFLLNAYLNFYSAAAMQGTNLHLDENTGGPELKRMLDAPLGAVNPEGVVPANNDREHVSLFGSEYELAYRMYRDPAYIPLVRESRQRGLLNGGLISSQPVNRMFGASTALLFGVGEPCPGGEDAVCESAEYATSGSSGIPPYCGSRVFGDAGWAIVRARRVDGAAGKYFGSNAVYAFLDFGPHGGSHGHADKLNLYLYAGGVEITRDERNFGNLETRVRGESIYGSWAKQTLAHNTVVLNQASQIGARSRTDDEGTTGRLIQSSPGISSTDPYEVIEAGAESAYPELEPHEYRRVLLVTPEYVVDLFKVRLRSPVVIDWVFHILGNVEHTSGLEACDCSSSRARPGVNVTPGGGASGADGGNATIPMDMPAGSGYQWLRDVKWHSAGGRWDIRWDCGYVTSMVDGNARRVATARGPMTSSRDMPLVIDRRFGRETGFLAVHWIPVHSGELTIEVLDSAVAYELEVSGSGFRDRIILKRSEDSGKWNTEYSRNTLTTK